MENQNGTSIGESIRIPTESTRLAFHHVLDSLPADDMDKQSLNPGWTNREILFHMTLGFLILSSLLHMAKLFSRLPESWSRLFSAVLNAFTQLFNPVNAVGARGGAMYRRRTISSLDSAASLTPC